MTSFDYTPLPYDSVLIVDDDEAMRILVKECLKPFSEEPQRIEEGGEVLIDAPVATANFSIVEASYGEEAYRIAKKRLSMNKPFQIALVDMCMNGWDGLETIKHLKELDPRMNFLIVTGFPDRVRDKVSDELGSLPYLVIPKPFSPEDLFGQAYALTKRWCRIHGD